MSTFEPRPPYSPAELAALYPPSLQLQLVQVLLRHGERTPVSPRFVNAGVPPFWPYCTAMRHLKSAVLDPYQPGQQQQQRRHFSTLEWKRRLEAFGPNDIPVVAAGPRGEVDDVCDMGMLTDRGRETTYDLGRRLRTLYVDQLAYLPPAIADADAIYLRTTPIPRALESLKQTFQGLYPPDTRAPGFPAPTIISRSPADETLFPNDSNCRRFAALARAFAQRAADRWNGSDEMDYLNRKLGKWMPSESPRVAVDSHPRLSGIMDTINATYAHGPQTRMPAEFYDPRVRQNIDAIAVEEWFAGYKESQEYRTLGIGGLLGDVVARMVGSVEHSAADGKYEITTKTPKDGASPIRLGLSGCHDTTLAGVLGSLGALKGPWPPFTSHIAIELFRRADQSAAGSSSPVSPAPQPSWLSSMFSRNRAGVPPAAGIGRKGTDKLSEGEKKKLQGYYVRLRYNDEPVTIPGCKLPGNHLEGDESFCTLVSKRAASSTTHSKAPGSPLTQSQEAFKAIVDKFTPHDWRQQCHANVDAPAFPAKPETAGF